MATTNMKVRVRLNRFPEAQRHIKQAVYEQLEAAATEIIENARKRVPVDTGELRETIGR